MRGVYECVCVRARMHVCVFMCDTVSARLISVKPPSEEEEDVDVARERRRVYEGNAKKDLLEIYDLTKVRCYRTTWRFKSIHACFSTPSKCF